LPPSPNDQSATPSVVTIRTANRNDVPAIFDLLTDLAKTLEETHLQRATREDIAREGFGDSPCFRVLLAEVSGRPVGMALFFEAFSSWRGRRGVYVQDLYVAPAQRGTGLGRRLLAAAGLSGKRAGCTHLRLSVAATNFAGRDFYRRIGMHERDDEVICQISDSDFNDLAGSIEQSGDE